jgi:hypothetical protein
MSDDLSDPFWRPPYDVGYKKPPESRRFVKGKSGNPRGRPTKKKPDPKPLVDKSTMESVLKVAQREVTVREGDSLAKIPAFDAIIQSMAAAAMKGNVQAQKTFVELVDEARREQAADIKGDHAFWRDYAATYDKYVVTLQRAGKPVPEGLPHPDDLVFEENCPVMLRGGDPIIAAQNWSTMVRFRDVLMLQAEQDIRCYPSEEKYQRRTTIFVSHYLLVHTNDCLPKRMQLSDDQIQFRMYDISCLRKRTLEERLRAGWADLGVPYAPNQITPPLKPLLAHFGIDVSKVQSACERRTHDR